MNTTETGDLPRNQGGTPIGPESIRALPPASSSDNAASPSAAIGSGTRPPSPTSRRGADASRSHQPAGEPVGAALPAPSSVHPTGGTSPAITNAEVRNATGEVTPRVDPRPGTGHAGTDSRQTEVFAGARPGYLAPLCYTVKEAAALLSCSADSISREIARGNLIAVGRHTGKRVDAASLHAHYSRLLEAATPKARDPRIAAGGRKWRNR